MEFKKKKHFVSQFRVEAEYTEKATAREIQAWVSSIINRKITGILENACDKYGQQKLIRIQRIELNLGNIPKEDLETALPRLFQKEIERVFSSILNDTHHAEGLLGVEVISQKRQLIDYFSFYLKNGILPWYMQDMGKEYSFSDVFSYLIEEDDGMFKNEFLSLLKHPAAKKRILFFFDSGEIWSFFKKNLSAELYHNAVFLYTEISALITHNNYLQGTDKTHLTFYIKDFLLAISEKQNDLKEPLSLKELTKKYVDFVLREKKISFEKWFPPLMKQYVKVGRDKSRAAIIIGTVQEYYVEYLLEQHKGFSLLSFSEGGQKGMEEARLYGQLEKRQPNLSFLLPEIVDNILLQISQKFPSIKKEKLRDIVWKSVANIIPSTTITENNLQQWTYSIVEEIKGVFGLPLKSIAIGEDGKSILSQEKKDGLAIKKQEFNIALVREYWDLFIKSGISPFKKLFKDPKKYLKKVFSEYIESETSDFKLLLKTELDLMYSPMLAWWVSDSFGEDFYTIFRQTIESEIGDKDFLPKKMEYDYILLLGFIRTGTLPWPELIDKGLDQMIKKIEGFLGDEKREQLVKILLQENFFNNEQVMKAVFSLMPINFGKELIKIRDGLIEKKILQLPERKAGKELKLKGWNESKSVREIKKTSEAKEVEDVKKVEKIENEQETIKKLSSGKEKGEKVDPSGELGLEQRKETFSDLDKVAQIYEEEEKAIAKQKKKEGTTAFALEETEGDQALGQNLVNKLARYILDFYCDKIPFDTTPKKRADFIYKELLKAVKLSAYETAAMLVGLKKGVLDKLFGVFDPVQKDYVKKLVRSYRVRFVSIAEEIEEGQKESGQADGQHKETVLKGPVFINNSGLVLLNPYIQRLFARLNLLDQKQFRSNDAKEKAISILQYISNKNEFPEEHEIPLNKLLVGIPLSTPLKLNVEITEEEKELCDGLLKAIIKNWAVLKNTSVEGLRASFLQRGGRLTYEAESWHLKVEKKAHDILLGKLPWGYTMIKMPWMDEPLFTEWE